MLFRVVTPHFGPPSNPTWRGFLCPDFYHHHLQFVQKSPASPVFCGQAPIRLGSQCPEYVVHVVRDSVRFPCTLSASSGMPSTPSSPGVFRCCYQILCVPICSNGFCINVIINMRIPNSLCIRCPLPARATQVVGNEFVVDKMRNIAEDGRAGPPSPVLGLPL